MISCLMVTQPGREQACDASVASFAAQDFSPRELVIVHDGPDAFNERLGALAEQWSDLEISIYQLTPGKTLGSLRNESINAARYPVVCQWDDDDLCHPTRLSRQYASMAAMDADFCFLTDQLHLYIKEKVLFWDDWSVETYPGNLIQGTIMGSKNRIGLYPDLAIGEDTGLVKRLVQEGHRIEALSDLGWLYLYIYDGNNAWDEAHHKAISHWKRRRHAALSRDLALLERVLRDYKLSLPAVDLLHENGKFTIQLDG